MTAWVACGSWTTTASRSSFDDARRADVARAHRRSRRGDRFGVPRLPGARARRGRARRPARRGRRRTRGRASSAISPTTRRRCTSSSSIGTSRCRHRRWRDPLADEWRDVVGAPRAARAALSGPQVASSVERRERGAQVEHEPVDVGDRGRIDVDADVERVAVPERRDVERGAGSRPERIARDDARAGEVERDRTAAQVRRREVDRARLVARERDEQRGGEQRRETGETFDRGRAPAPASWSRAVRGPSANNASRSSAGWIGTSTRAGANRFAAVSPRPRVLTGMAMRSSVDRRSRSARGTGRAPAHNAGDVRVVDAAAERVRDVLQRGQRDAEHLEVPPQRPARDEIGVGAVGDEALAAQRPRDAHGVDGARRELRRVHERIRGHRRRRARTAPTLRRVASRERCAEHVER